MLKLRFGLQKLICNLIKFEKFLICIFMILLSSAYFFQNQHFQKNFRNTNRMSTSLELDQAWNFVRPDLGPKYLQRYIADNKVTTSRQRAKKCVANKRAN